MEPQNYNLAADILDKFHNSENLVQIAALAAATIILSIAFLVLGYIARVLKDAAAFKTPRGKLLYSIYLGDENQAIIFRHHASSEIMMVKPDLEKLQS